MPTDIHGSTKGSNKTPSSRLYRCFNRKKIKDSVESYKVYARQTRKVSPSVKSALAYFAGGKEINERQS